MRPTILAFMQNMWVRDPERVRSLIARHGEPYRRRLIATALFAGCLSGRRLKAAFGEELCRQIKWEEASPVVSGESRASPPADPMHMRRAIDHYAPQIIITFGAIAGFGLKHPEVAWRGEWIATVHPAARHGEGPLQLERAAADLRARIAELQA